MSEQIKISVILPAYNAERFLEQAVDSVLGQSYGDFELLLFDDGSSDATPRIVEAAAKRDSRVRPFTGENRGLLGVLQQATNEARGEYIARMDADDICLPDRFRLQVAHFDRHPDCVAVGSQVLYIDPDGDPLGFAKVSEQHAEIDAQLLGDLEGKIGHPTVMMRTEAVRRVGGYVQEYHYEDVDLFLKLAEIGELANIPTPLLKYRLHPNSICHTRNMRRCREIYREIITSACARRNLPSSWPSAELIEDVGHSTTATATNHSPIVESHRYWCSMAIKAGFRKTAIKHAWRALRMAPSAPRCWWTALSCLVGIRATTQTFDFINSLRPSRKSATAVRQANL